ncbi:MAG: sigma-54 dependent transcriptional regulator, partial [Bacteroidales bacterium]|nr:sigma-54 dependent transcriptional regulator [Bacteroidales bacterium]
FMTAYSDTDKAVRAIKAGAMDFIPKPWEREKLLSTLSAALKLCYSQQEVTQLKEQVSALTTPGEEAVEMIGQSAAMEEVFRSIEKLAETSANILVLGENGTGKDLVARSLYRNSPRFGAPFVSIDLGAIPETLFESELFGYEKGAFTDAKAAKAGRIEVANGGTLFLDEIGNLSLQMQAKLLTVIEKKRISRLGATSSIAVDIRLICATNRDLRAMVEEGTFREDLLYRINTMEIHIPPLRERGKDILLLAEYFQSKYTYKYKKVIYSIASDAQAKLLKYAWPGNVRELQHAMERAVILCDGKTLRSEHFTLQPPTRKVKEEQEVSLNLEQLERQAIEKAMRLCDGNVTRAGEMLGISRYALYRKLKELNL